VLGSSGKPPAKRSPVVAATIETPKIHKLIDAGERHFRSVQSKKLQNSPGFHWEHLVMHRFNPRPPWFEEIMP
jgi:ribonuclease BN (tRNA processing enzyme)